MKTSTEITVYLDREERFDIPAQASYSGAKVTVRVETLRYRTTEGAEPRLTVTGPKVRKDGGAGQYTTNGQADYADLPEAVRAALTAEGQSK